MNDIRPLIFDPEHYPEDAAAKEQANRPSDAASCSAALRGWGPMTIATVQAADLTEGTVTLRIQGPFPSTILGGQWFLFPDAPPAALRPDLDFMVQHTCSSHPDSQYRDGQCVPCQLGWPPSSTQNK